MAFTTKKSTTGPALHGHPLKPGSSARIIVYERTSAWTAKKFVRRVISQTRLNVSVWAVEPTIRGRQLVTFYVTP
jgi:hypothetical protein